MTKLASKLPDDHGLGALKLIKEPEQVHVVLALVDCKQLLTDVDTGDVEPTVRVLRVEILTDADKPAAEKMLRAAIEKRTGARVLPGLEDDPDFTAAFRQGR